MRQADRVPRKWDARIRAGVRSGSRIAIGLLLGWSSVACPALADVPDDRSGRIRTFQAELLRVTTPSSDSYEIRRGEGTASVLVDDLALLRQAHDGEREREVSVAWAWRATGQALVALLAIPAGAWLTFDNFLGKPRPAGVAPYVPDPVTSLAPGGDLASYALATIGIGLAAWGVSEGGAWVSERLGWSAPRFLEVAEAVEQGTRARKALLVDWALVEADVGSASALPSLASVPASPSGPVAAVASSSVAATPGGALAALSTASSVLRAQRGEGYRLVVVSTRSLPDASGILGRGEWHVGWQHRDRPEWLDVAVPVFGEAPRIAPLPEGLRAWGWSAGSVPREEDLAAAPEVDSPRALKALIDDLSRRGIPVLLDETTLIWVARHPRLGRSVWMLETPDGPLPVAIDARTGQPVELPAAGVGTLPTVPQAPAR
ncbi:MAG: hypothetical protein VKP72_03025 [bacterium]|nr:hypothetical protein [bacterium]